MTDANEIAALQASYRGALSTADGLRALSSKIEGLGPDADINPEDFDELARVTAAHAIASGALRGLVNTMAARRGVAAD